jgi:tRNA (guanine37-N1)-methyltransferase
MVLRVEPVAAALDELRRPDSTVVLLDPAGSVFDQRLAHDLATASHLVFVCARYEGVDERIRSLVDLELSIGDYVVTGGELPALVVIDAVLRLLPGAIDAASTDEESFSDGLLEYPQYTRPAEFRGMGVPPVLVSGHHGEVARCVAKRSAGRSNAGRSSSTVARPRRSSAPCCASSRRPARSASREPADPDAARAARVGRASPPSVAPGGLPNR